VNYPFNMQFLLSLSFC